MSTMFKRITRGVEGFNLSLFESVITSVYADAVIHTSTTDDLIFSIPSISDKRIKLHRTSYNYYSNRYHYLSASVGIPTGNDYIYVEVLPEGYISSTNSTSPLYTDIFATSSGLVVSSCNDVGAISTYAFVIAKGSDDNYYAFGLSDISNGVTRGINISDEIEDTENIDYCYILPLGDVKRYGLFKDAQLELHKVQLKDGNATLIVDESGNEVYLKNFFATITDDIAIRNIYMPNAGFVIGDTQYQYGNTYTRRNLFLSEEELI